MDLALEPGAPVVLAGANGSGKSTLLRILAGCSAPTSGRVLGRPRVVGYLPDRFPAQLRMPADVYLRHLAQIRGVGVDTGLLETLGFTGRRGEPMARLSKGNAQKVGLAQALGCGAGLVVLDEPWAGLDVDAAEVLVELLTGVDAALLVTDHTGRAARIPGARHLALESGVVSERHSRSLGVSESAARSPEAGAAGASAGAGERAARSPGRSESAVRSAETAPIPAVRVVVLRCADPAGLAAALGVVGRVDGHRLVLDVAGSDVDGLLLAALQRGGSVESVR
ncbi:ABC transporter ATP-binding protein [Pseudonocardia ailaonensis]|uniref:ABC transporter ATP-binding protein n=1 Tax=Pseudonocardia ailaonensis TaxID=367279 RepID=UPI0031E21A9C